MKFAARGDGRSYHGCLVVDVSGEAIPPDQDASYEIRDHLNATAYLGFLCTLLVNDAKAQYERSVADHALDALLHDLETRQHAAADLLQQQSALKAVPGGLRRSMDEIVAAHLTDRRRLDRFDQLVDTYQRNSEQFEEVASILMKSDNAWAASVRLRLKSENADLRAARRSLWRQFHTTQAYLKEVRQRSKDSSDPGREEESTAAFEASEIRDQVFVSYSHKDSKWLSELKIHLTPYLGDRSGLNMNQEMIWDDTMVKAGSQWMGEIKQALARAKAAILLVTPEFLSSEFIRSHEIPALLRDEVILFWIPVRTSSYEVTFLDRYQACGSPDRPLSALTGNQRDREWVEICKKIFARISVHAE